MDAADVLLWILLVGLPNALFYGAVIAVLWWGARRRWPGRTVLPWVALGVAAAAVLLTVPGNIVTERRARAVAAVDVTPARRIVLAGDVLLDPVEDYREPVPTTPQWEVARDDVEAMRRSGKYDAARDCGRLCRLLLATPGVRGVIVTPEHERIVRTVSPNAVRYQRSATGRCGVGAGASIDLIDIASLDGPPPDFCVEAGPPPARVDMAVRVIRGLAYADDRRFDPIEIELLPRPIPFRRTEIADAAGRVLLRRTVVTPSGIAVPLLMSGFPLEVKIIVGVVPGIQEPDVAALSALQPDLLLPAYTDLARR